MLSKNDLQAFHETSRTLIKANDFMYILPHPSLRPWVSNYTITFPSADIISDKYSVIPHGCATLVFAFDGNSIVSNLFGPASTPAYVGNEANKFRLLFIVEFQPAGLYAFSGMPQKELTDCVIPFVLINPVMDRLIAQHLESVVDLHGLIAEIDRLLLSHLKITHYKPEFSLAYSMILDSGGRASVKDLSHTVFYSERHLGRIFEEYLGLGAKSFSRLVRVNKAVRFLRQPQNSITQAYLGAGFYDLPHFIRDFKSICGITPQEYRDNMSDFYSEIAKF